MGRRAKVIPAIRRRLGFRRIAHVRDALNRLTRGRVGLYSTAEHYSSGPSARVLRYYQYDRGNEIGCPSCGWRGRGDQAAEHMFNELFDVRCPSCGMMLLVVGYPTLAEIQEAARQGNAEAQRELVHIEEASRRANLKQHPQES
jgi:hypothetical protein